MHFCALFSFHSRRGYHNCPLSTVNCPLLFDRLCPPNNNLPHSLRSRGPKDVTKLPVSVTNWLAVLRPKKGKGCPPDAGRCPCSANILVYFLELYSLFPGLSILFPRIFGVKKRNFCGWHGQVSAVCGKCLYIPAAERRELGKATKMPRSI